MSCTTSGACIPDHWDFEDGAVHGFGNGPNDLIHLSGTVVHGGSFSLEIQPNPATVASGFGLFSQSYNVNGPSNGTAGDCPSSSDLVNRESKTLSGWIHLDSPPAGSTVSIYAGSDQRGSVLVTTVPAANGWFSFSTGTTNVGNVRYFDATITIPGGAVYAGVIYIDDLSWK
jgi:hypothetical protein